MIAGSHQPHSMETATQASPQITAMLEAARAALLEDGGEPAALQSALEAATEVASLTQDADLALATALHWARRLGALAREPAAKQPWLNSAALSLAAGLERLGELHLPANWSAGQMHKAAQAEVLRK